MKEPTWLKEASVRLIHERLISEFGGSAGIRDIKLLDSALNRPIHTFTYEVADIFDLAAAYAYGLVKNHPFIDGNKRIALTASRVFLLENGYTVKTSQEEKFKMFYALAAGTVTQKELAQWFRTHATRLV